MRAKVWTLARRISSLLQSLWLRLPLCHNAYPPEAWILHYYPQFYFAKLVKHRLRVGNGREDRNSSLGAKASWMKNTLSLEATALPLIIFYSLSYTSLIFYYYFFDKNFGKNSKASELEDPTFSQKNDPHGFANSIPAKILETSLTTGLCEDEVIARRKIYGYNETWTRRNWFLFFRRTFIGPTNLILEITAILALVAQDWRDLLICCGLLAYNNWFSVATVKQYDSVAKSMALNSSIKVLVVRGSKIINVTIKELVPGDVVHISEGSVVPADCRVSIHDSDIYIDQSSITNENTGIRKTYGDTCYAATGVLRGDAFLTVIATGHHTFIGRTLSLLSDPSPQSSTPLRPLKTALQQQEFLRTIHCFGISICLLIVLCLIIIRVFLDTSGSPKISLELYIAVIFAAIPVNLMTQISSMRAHAAARLTKDGVIVQSISNSEHLAGIDIICVDKTGTLTENRLTILEPYATSGDVDDVILTACLTISPPMTNLDPIDRTLFRALNQYPGAKNSLAEYTTIGLESFNPETKRIVSVVEAHSGERVFCTKGAPRAVLDTCLRDNPDTQKFTDEYTKTVSQYAQRGLRSLGIARKYGNHRWELLGLVPLLDPPRFDSARAIKKAKDIGVSVRMVTGDAVSLAREMAVNVGLKGTTLLAESVSDDNLNSSQNASTLIEEADVYAEVFPSDKEKIVRTLQSRGHLVAATGDGVSDAPTLRRADCGIAAEGSTETAQSASDIVFTKGGFSGMVQAIEKSRQNFQLTYTYIESFSAINNN